MVTKIKRSGWTYKWTTNWRHFKFYQVCLVKVFYGFLDLFQAILFLKWITNIQIWNSYCNSYFVIFHFQAIFHIQFTVGLSPSWTSVNYRIFVNSKNQICRQIQRQAWPICSSHTIFEIFVYPKPGVLKLWTSTFLMYFGF